MHRSASPLPMVAATLAILMLPLAPGAAGAASQAGLDETFSDLDRRDSPGCAVGLVRDGALAFAEGYGSANLDHELPITPGTVFYMGSVSKQFTAAAVALAAARGELSLDDDIRTHVPELRDYGTPITIRHLVHHTSGIRDYLTLQALAGGFDGTTDEQVLALLARQRRTNFTPGERYLYSNSGYFLLSEILERATGLTLRQFAEREFFRPLGMRSSHFHDDADHIVRHRATGYAPAGDGFRMNHAWRYEQVGAGGLYSSVEDMARWVAAFEEGRIGPPGFRDALFERGVLANGDTLDYAFGISLGEHRGLRTIAHGGALAGFRSQMLWFPDERTAVLVLCNLSSAEPGRRAMEVAERALGERMEPAPPRVARNEGEEADTPPGSPTAAGLAPFEGRYYSDELEAHHVVRMTDGRLVLEIGGRRLPLRLTDEDTFRAPLGTLRFERRDGRITGYVLDAGRANGLVFERTAGPGAS